MQEVRISAIRRREAEISSVREEGGGGGLLAAGGGRDGGASERLEGF